MPTHQLDQLNTSISLCKRIEYFYFFKIIHKIKEKKMYKNDHPLNNGVTLALEVINPFEQTYADIKNSQDWKEKDDNAKHILLQTWLNASILVAAMAKKDNKYGIRVFSYGVEKYRGGMNINDMIDKIHDIHSFISAGGKTSLDGKYVDDMKEFKNNILNSSLEIQNVEFVNYIYCKCNMSCNSLIVCEIIHKKYKTYGDVFSLVNSKYEELNLESIDALPTHLYDRLNHKITIINPLKLDPTKLYIKF